MHHRADNEEEDEDRSWEPRIYHNIPLRPGTLTLPLPPQSFAFCLCARHQRQCSLHTSDQRISSEEELSAPLWHAVMGSAAAPTFFPSFNKVWSAHRDRMCESEC